MPSQKTAPQETKMVKCEVLRGIGVDATPETLKEAKGRAETKGLRFNPAGLTTMIYPNKPVISEDGKTFKDGEEVFVELEMSVARKLQKAGAVRVCI